MRVLLRTWPAVALGVLLTACGSPPPPVIVPPPATTSAPPAPPGPREALRLDPGVLADAGGPLADGMVLPSVAGDPDDVLGMVDGVLRTEGEGLGGLSVVDGAVPGTRALQFPEACSDDPDSCGRAIIEVPGGAGLDLIDEDFRLGATLRMSPDQVSKGANVVQRGFSLGGEGQWKLQVDGREGLPSCVLVGSGDTTIHMATSDRGVADDEWHLVDCVRQGSLLQILVDDEVEGAVELPPGLSADPDGPVLIGGKNLKPNNDQFRGAIDEVHVLVGPVNGDGTDGEAPS